MAKRAVLAALCLLAALGLSAGSFVYTQRTCDVLLSAAERAYASPDAELLGGASRFLERYAEKKATLNSFLCRKDADDLRAAVFGLSIFVDAGDLTGARERLGDAIVILRVIAEGETPKKENIF